MFVAMTTPKAALGSCSEVLGYFLPSSTSILWKKLLALAKHEWLTPVILATQEAEIRRITVWSQPVQIVHKTLSRRYPSQKKGQQSGSRCRPWVQISVLQWGEGRSTKALQHNRVPIARVKESMVTVVCVSVHKCPQRPCIEGCGAVGRWWST
jgi:hypothetical protein